MTHNCKRTRIRAWAWKRWNGSIPVASVYGTRARLIECWPWNDSGKIIRVEIRELPHRSKGGRKR